MTATSHSANIETALMLADETRALVLADRTTKRNDQTDARDAVSAALRLAASLTDYHGGTSLSEIEEILGYHAPDNARSAVFVATFTTALETFLNAGR
jgi:hypothetical protein